MIEIPYNQLDRYFTEPFTKKHYNRIPRKMKKKWKDKLQQLHEGLTIGQKVWYLLEFTNPNYKRFLIKCIAERP